MKKQSKNLVPTDQSFVGTMNLVTGAKFNYDKQLPTQAQIKELCISDNKSKQQKFVKIIQEGEKIQKWSVLQNLNYYCQLNIVQNRHKTPMIQIILQCLIKNYTQLSDFLGIMGWGISKVLQKFYSQLSMKAISQVFQLGFRILTYHPNYSEQWENSFERIAQKCTKQEKQQCYEYILGAFQMNSPPEKRKSALIMINAFFENESKIQLQAYSKVLFFSSDQNFKTRLIICKIIFKLLKNKKNDEQIWRAVWEYFNDKEEEVKNKAIQLIFSYNYESNFRKIMEVILAQEELEHITIDYLDNFLHNYSAMIHSDKKSKIQIIAFCNRIFNSKKVQNICILLSKFKTSLVPVLGETLIFSDINFGALKLKQIQILESFFKIYQCANSIEFKQNIKILCFKSLKEIKYQINNQITNLSLFFDLSIEQETSIYYSICCKFLQNSKWYQLQQFLKVFDKAKLYQNIYDKFCLFFLKTLVNAPQFLLSTLINCIMHLLILNRRNLDFFITLRQKLMNAKSWFHRSIYISIYSAIKQQTSFEYHKLIPTVVYKNILNQKSYGVKLVFLKESSNIYKYIEPQNTDEKKHLKQTVIKMIDDKDRSIRQSALKAKKDIQKAEKQYSHMQQIYRRSEELYEKEQATLQVLTEQKKVIKTQNQIRKSLFKKKTLNENRRTTNTIKQTSGIYKDVSIDSLNPISKKKVPYLDYNYKEKKTNLFRCHSVKMKVPTSKKN